MSLYEHVFIARPDVSQQQVEQLSEQFAGVIRDNGGKIAKTEYWGLRNLAYKIKKNRKGHYALMNIDAPHAAVAEMERQMSLHDDIMRFMTVSVDELEEGPSAVLQGRGREERRPSRGPRVRDDSDSDSDDSDSDEDTNS